MNKTNEGKRVMLIEMFGEKNMKKGLLGTIMFEDDAFNIHVKWDNGSVLSLLPEKDKYKILNDKDIRKLKLNKINENR